MKDIDEIIEKYTSGEYTAEHTNVMLATEGTIVRLDEGKNTLTKEEIASTTVGDSASCANGFGLLDTSTATLDKVHVENGFLTNGDCGEMFATCTIGGKTYRVVGKELME